MLNTYEIKRRREAKGINQADAARAARFSTAQQWWNVENGASPMPRLNTLLSIADALECSIADIVIEKHKPQARAQRREKQP